MDQKKQQEVVIFLMTVFVAALVGYNGLYKYDQGQLEKVQKQIEQEKLKNDLLEEISILEARIRKFKQRSFSSTEITPLVDKVSEYAKEANIAIDTFDPVPLKRGEDFTAISLILPMKCSYHKLGKFLSLIESNKEFMRIEVLKIRRSVSGEAVGGITPEVQLVLSGFYFR